MTLADFAEQHLFAPLGIDSYHWYAFPNAPEMTVASSTLFLRPRDMAKIGQMYLDGGLWNGTRVVSEGWVSQSTQQAAGMAESPVLGLPSCLISSPYRHDIVPESLPSSMKTRIGHCRPRPYVA